MTRGELIDAVRTRIDEIASQGEAIVDVGVEENIPTDVMIDSVLDESARLVLMTAPVIRLNVSDGSTSPVKSNNGIGQVELPSDFLRFVSFQMEDWEQPVYTVATPEGVLSGRQKNKYLRRGKCKPIVVLLDNAIEYFSSLSDTIKEFRYIALSPAEEMRGGVATDAMLWVATAKVLSIIHDTGGANVAMEHAKNLLV